MGRLDITPVLTSKELSSQGGLLTSSMRNLWSLPFSLGRAQPPVSIVLLFSSGSIGPQGTNLHLLTLGGGIYVLPQWDPLSCRCAGGGRVTPECGRSSG